jgi:hypothetical protein
MLAFLQSSKALLNAVMPALSVLGIKIDTEYFNLPLRFKAGSNTWTNEKRTLFVTNLTFVELAAMIFTFLTFY